MSERITIEGAEVRVEQVIIDGLTYTRRMDTGEYPNVHGPFAEGTYGVCGACGQRPCVDGCPVQKMPDLLRYKARRAGLDEDAWLARWAAEHDGEAWEDRYPQHPEAARLRAERRQESA